MPRRLQTPALELLDRVEWVDEAGRVQTGMIRDFDRRLAIIDKEIIDRGVQVETDEGRNPVVVVRAHTRRI
jgi:hypothetical protein